MNKICKCLVLTIGLLIGFTINAKAVNAATLSKTYTNYWYNRSHADGSNAHSWHHPLVLV